MCIKTKAVKTKDFLYIELKPNETNGLDDGGGLYLKFFSLAFKESKHISHKMASETRERKREIE